jgi:hypothetical protein
VKGSFDLKNEIRITIVADDHFMLWQEFLEKHVASPLINPDTGLCFNEAKSFKVSAKTLLHQEFFKTFGSFHRRGLVGLHDASARKDPEHVALLAESVGLQGSEGPLRSLRSTRLGGEAEVEDDRSSGTRCNKPEAAVHQARWHGR